MNYKVEGAIKKTRKYFIIYAILWLFMVIVFIMPAGAAIAEASAKGTFAISMFFERFIYYVMKPFGSFSKVFDPAYIGSFWSVLWKFTFVYLIIVVISIIKNVKRC